MARPLRGCRALRQVCGAVIAGALVLASATSADADSFFVTNTNDTGAGSLRQAILSANATAGQDSIQFSISLAAGAVATIAPLTPLPDITEAVSIAGYSQPGSVKNSLATGFDAVLRIRLSGASAGPGVSGLVIKAAGVAVDGLIIDGFGGAAVQVLAGAAASSIIVTGNVLGKGYAALPLAGNTRGVSVDGAPNVVVGGIVAEDRNLIAGNQQEAVLIAGAASTNTVVRGNRIGLNDAGTAEGNRYGVRVLGGSVLIGVSPTGVGTGNTIAASAEADVQVESGSFAIHGNRIGTDDAGLANRAAPIGILLIGATGGQIGSSTLATRNVVLGSQRAIELRQSSGVTVANNYVCRNASGVAIGTCGRGILVQEGSAHTIGGHYISGTRFSQGNVIANCQVGIELAQTTTGNTVEANTIEDNTGVGVLVTSSSNNFIGSLYDTALGGSLGNTVRRNGGGSTTPRGGVVVSSGTGNALLRNSVSDNTPLGIDLGGDGETFNDKHDADTGPNNGQNYPALFRVTVGATTQVEGMLASLPSQTYRIQFFRSAALNGSGHAEGQLYLGETTVTTDAADHAFWTVTLPAISPGAIVTATATRLVGATPVETSEFSPGLTAATPALPTITAVTPMSGPTAGGTVLTVTGTFFFITVTTVTIGGTAATDVLVLTPTSLVATTPAHAAGLVDVSVTTSVGTTTRANAFTYVVPPAPTVTAITPTSGPAAGGTPVTLTGTNFLAGATVTIGGTAANSVVVVSPTTITAVTPSHAAGAVNVVVTTTNGTGTLTNGFTYLAPPPPTVTAIAPASGPAAGGTPVTLMGTNFLAGATVTLGGAAATSVVVVSATSITAVTPSHAAGAVNVVVTTTNGTGTLTNGFTYVAPQAPTVTAILVALNRLRAASLEPLEVEFEKGVPVRVAGRVPAGTGSERPWARASRFLDEYRNLYQIVSDGSVRFRTSRQRMDADGTSHVFLQQVRESIPVYGAGIALHFRGNEFTSSNGRWVSSLSPWYATAVETSPSISFQVAFERAAAHVGGATPDPSNLVGKPGLVFYWPELDHDGTWTPPPSSPAGLIGPNEPPRLAWRLAFNAPGGPWDAVVDATDGSVLDATTRQRTAFDLELFDARFNTSAICFSSPFSPNHTLWFTEEGRQVREGLLDGDGDGQRGFELIREVYDYWLREHDRDSYDNDEGQIEMFVNYGNEPNAFGSVDCLRFADAYVTRDIVAHEFTHAVTDSTAGLAYRREAGAIHETLSDVFAKLLDTDDWLIGNDLPGSGNSCAGANPGAIRDMAWPANCITNWDFDSDGNNDPFPDHVDPAVDTGGIGQRRLADGQSPGGGNDDGYVHVNSSILNKAAHLVAQGGGHHGVAVSGLGREVLGRIWYRALTSDDLPSGAHFVDLRWATRMAADHLYGWASNEKCQVTNAFAAVGIGSPDSDCDGLEDDDEAENDDDNDAVTDALDNCPLVPNPDQDDADDDDLGDRCDEDADNDGLLNDGDNCRFAANPGQSDVDRDGVGDACDDSDGDLVMDSGDNCRLTPNGNQIDTDGDGVGDACDTDADGDGRANDRDNCPLRANPGWIDSDDDGDGDACDNCPAVANANQANGDGDKWGDACDADDDNDRVPDVDDVCQFAFDPQQIDKDRNGRGLACDSDEAFMLGGDPGWSLLDVPFLTQTPVEIPVFPCVDDDCPTGGEPFAPGQRYTLRLGNTTNVDARIVDAAGRVVARGVRGAAGQTLDFEVAPAFRAASGASMSAAAALGGRVSAAAVSVASPWAPGPDEPAYFLQLRPLSSSLLGQRVSLSVSAGLHAGPDTDGDGVTDNVDSCVAVANADQADADGDGLGDGCDNCRIAANGPALPIGGLAAQADADADTTGDACDVPRYLAEGATSAFFDTRLALANPTETAQHLVLRFQTGDGSLVTHDVTLPALTRMTFDPKVLSGFDRAEFSTTVESAGPVLVDRTMTWDAAGFGSHAETAVLTPALTWYLAEGATHSGFELFYLIQNPDPAEAATVEVTYLRPAGQPPLVRTYAVDPHSRFNIWVDTIEELNNTDVSAVLRVTNGRPIIVERAMYLNGHGRAFDAGHESAGVTAPATNWFLAEGATGPFFDLFLLVANPGAQPARVRATYLLPAGPTLVKDYLVAPQSRFNIWVDLEDPRLADTAVSVTLDSLDGVPIIVERAMWWGDADGWYEAHNSPGTTATGTAWGLAEGEVGGPRDTATYVLIANTSSAAATVRVRLLFEDGTTAERTFAVAARSRFNVDVGFEFPVARDRRFGTVVESLGDPPARIVVERAMYTSPGGVFWAAGTNALAARLK